MYTFKFTTPGTYDYVCTLHGGMNGTIIVPTTTAGPPAGTGRPPGRRRTPRRRPRSRAGRPGKAGKHGVTVTDAGFSPANLYARAGDTVTWVNTGRDAAHRDLLRRRVRPALEPGASASTVLQEPGTIHYVCSYHSYMTASIVVGAALPGVVIAPAPGEAPGTAAGSAAVSRDRGPPAAKDGKTKTYEVKVQEKTFAPRAERASRRHDQLDQRRQDAAHGDGQDGSFDHQLLPGATFNYVLRRQGTVDYVCTFHPGMDGILMVGPALAGVRYRPPRRTPGAAAAAAPARPPPRSSSGKTKIYEIKVKENSFAPSMEKARVGDTISWVNVGRPCTP